MTGAIVRRDVGGGWTDHVAGPRQLVPAHAASGGGLVVVRRSNLSLRERSDAGLRHGFRDDVLRFFYLMQVWHYPASDGGIGGMGHPLLHSLLKQISLQFRLKGGRFLGQIMQVLAERGAELPL